MRRAVLALFALPAFLALPVPPASAAEQTPDVIDGAGLVNYMQRPRFRVGTWVKYRTIGRSLRGQVDDYTVTVLVAGEEVFWGEPCFWIETWTQKAGRSELAAASLVSYAAFGDTFAIKQPMWFIRKTINGTGENGQPDVNIVARDPGDFRARKQNLESSLTPIRVDSIGPDTTTVPAGHYKVFKVKQHQVTAATADQGDSTTYYEARFDRTFFYTPDVPLTNVARIDIDHHQLGKTWLAGHFDKSGLKTLERAQGETLLLGYGTSGLTPVLVPEAWRRSIDRKLVEEFANQPAEPGIVPVRRSKAAGS
jgi:hypothetical protein